MSKWVTVLLALVCGPAFAGSPSVSSPGMMGGARMGMQRYSSTYAPRSLSQYGCSSCHAMDRASAGPAWRWIAWRYENRPQAIREVARFIEHGGRGYWGGRMPDLNVPPRVAMRMAEWILERRPEPPPH